MKKVTRNRGEWRVMTRGEPCDRRSGVAIDRTSERAVNCPTRVFTFTRFEPKMVARPNRLYFFEIVETFLTYLIAAVWVANGLFCKVLDLVPRHRMIVGRILGEDHALLITKLIGLAEIGMTVWVLSGIAEPICAITQIVIIAAMNVLEFFLAPDLLLWGRLNALFAFCLIVLIFYKAFLL